MLDCLGIVRKWRHRLRGRGYKGFCDDSTEALELKSVMMGEEVSKIVKNYQKLRDVIYGRPFSDKRNTYVWYKRINLSW